MQQEHNHKWRDMKEKEPPENQFKSSFLQYIKNPLLSFSKDTFQIATQGYSFNLKV